MRKKPHQSQYLWYGYLMDEGSRNTSTKTPTQIIAQRVKQIRHARGLSLDAMSKELVRRFGAKWDYTKLSRVEKLEDGRELTIIEWLHIAAVLNVSPGALLTPANQEKVTLGETDQNLEFGLLNDWIDGRSNISDDDPVQSFADFSTPRWAAAQKIRRSLGRYKDNPQPHEWMDALWMTNALPGILSEAMLEAEDPPPENYTSSAIRDLQAKHSRQTQATEYWMTVRRYIDRLCTSQLGLSPDELMLDPHYQGWDGDA